MNYSINLVKLCDDYDLIISGYISSQNVKSEIILKNKTIDRAAVTNFFHL